MESNGWMMRPLLDGIVGVLIGFAKAADPSRWHPNILHLLEPPADQLPTA